MKRTCPKCKSPTLLPLSAVRPGDDANVPPSRCSSCRGVWLPHEALHAHVVPVAADASTRDPAMDERAGFCPRCRGILVRARVDAKPPFHLDRCPACAGIWFDAGEWAAMASTEWLSHLDDLWDPVWRRRVREQRAHKRHLETLAQALGDGAFKKVSDAIQALERHPMRSLALSFLIEELQSPRK